MYTEVITPSDRLYDYLEDYKLTWLDDLPSINTLIVKQLKQLKGEEDFLVFLKYIKTKMIRNLLKFVSKNCFKRIRVI